MTMTLAIVWGVEHFHIYVYGHKFVLVTDHKPLETIHGNRTSKTSEKIERWVLRLQPYSFTVQYKTAVVRIQRITCPVTQHLRVPSNNE